MKFLSRILVLGGYILVYAGIANHGRFATSPWMGVFRDAYGVDSQAKGAGSDAGPPVGSARPGVRVGTPTNPSTGAGGGTGAVNPKTKQPVRPRTGTGGTGGQQGSFA